jgi:hypothetical protein
MGVVYITFSNFFNTSLKYSSGDRFTKVIVNHPRTCIRSRKEIVRVILDLRFTITLVKRSPDEYFNDVLEKLLNVTAPIHSHMLLKWQMFVCKH